MQVANMVSPAATNNTLSYALYTVSVCYYYQLNGCECVWNVWDGADPIRIKWGMPCRPRRAASHATMAVPAHERLGTT